MLAKTSNNGEQEPGRLLVLAAHANDGARVIQILSTRPSFQFATEKEGYYAIHWAVHHNNAEMVQCLLDGVDSLGVRTKVDESALQLAVNKKHWYCVLAIMEYDAKHRGRLESEYDRTFFEAVKVNKVEVVKQLLPLVEGPSRWFEEVDELLDIHWAVKHNNVEMLKLLLEGGATVDAKTKTGDSALKLAVNEMYWDCVSALLEYSAIHGKVFRQEYGWALFRAAKDNRTTVVEWLLNVSGKTSTWYIPSTGFRDIHYAVQHHNSEMVRMLLKAGASLSAGVEGGQDVVQFAVSCAIRDKKGDKCLLVIVEHAQEAWAFENLLYVLVASACLQSEFLEVALKVATEGMEMFGLYWTLCGRDPNSLLEVIKQLGYKDPDVFFKIAVQASAQFSERRVSSISDRYLVRRLRKVLLEGLQEDFVPGIVVLAALHSLYRETENVYAIGRVYLMRGWRHYLAGNYQEAIADANRALCIGENKYEKEAKLLYDTAYFEAHKTYKNLTFEELSPTDMEKFILTDIVRDIDAFAIEVKAVQRETRVKIIRAWRKKAHSGTAILLTVSHRGVWKLYGKKLPKGKKLWGHAILPGASLYKFLQRTELSAVKHSSFVRKHIKTYFDYLNMHFLVKKREGLFRCLEADKKESPKDKLRCIVQAEGALKLANVYVQSSTLVRVLEHLQQQKANVLRSDAPIASCVDFQASLSRTQWLVYLVKQKTHAELLIEKVTSAGVHELHRTDLLPKQDGVGNENYYNEQYYGGFFSTIKNEKRPGCIRIEPLNDQVKKDVFSQLLLDKDYHHCWARPAAEVQKMIDSIVEDSSQKDLYFQICGKFRGDYAHNCTSWVAEKLKIIGVDIVGLKLLAATSFWAWQLK